MFVGFDADNAILLRHRKPPEEVFTFLTWSLIQRRVRKKSRRFAGLLLYRVVGMLDLGISVVEPAPLSVMPPLFNAPVRYTTLQTMPLMITTTRTAKIAEPNIKSNLLMQPNATRELTFHGISALTAAFTQRSRQCCRRQKSETRLAGASLVPNANEALMFRDTVFYELRTCE